MKIGLCALALLVVLAGVWVVVVVSGESRPGEGRAADQLAPSTIDATDQAAAEAALLRLGRFRASDAPPVEAVFVKRATLREFNDVTGGGGTDPGVAETNGVFVAVYGAFEVTPPGGGSAAAPFRHAYILMGPGGDELAVHVTNDSIDLTGFERVPA